MLACQHGKDRTLLLYGNFSGMVSDYAFTFPELELATLPICNQSRLEIPGLPMMSLHDGDRRAERCSGGSMNALQSSVWGGMVRYGYAGFPSVELCGLKVARVEGQQVSLTVTLGITNPNVVGAQAFYFYAYFLFGLLHE